MSKFLTRSVLENLLGGILIGASTQGMIRFFDYQSSIPVNIDGKIINPVHVDKFLSGPLIAGVSIPCVISSIRLEHPEKSRAEISVPFILGYGIGTCLSYADKIWQYFS